MPDGPATLVPAAGHDHPNVSRPAELAEVVRLVDADPLVNVVVAARLQAAGSLEPRRLGGTLLATRDAAGGLSGAVLDGGNLLPVGGGPAQWRALAEHLARGRRRCSSIVGRVEAVEAMWDVLARSWGPPRAIRTAQPLLVLDRGAPLPAGDERVQPVRLADVDRYVPAAAAMFTEELGVSPYRLASPAEYRRRVAGLAAAGRAFAIVDGTGEVLFKADLGAVSAQTCQVQGVWVRPDLRGRGIGTAALAAVLRRALTLAPTVSLYVNHFNVPARRMYARLGLRPAATLSTVLF
ncbi:MAG TPA: GNAT family N-acetyltransferase [Jatrophihabitans sp.]|nr:GNAT family N-acetyltransferase [Jatrophihabitans sp.]